MEDFVPHHFCLGKRRQVEGFYLASDGGKQLRLCEWPA